MRKVQLISFTLFLILIASFVSEVHSQVVTSSSMSGIVTDTKGDALPGANIIAVHEPSGTQYGTSSRVDGRYNINGMRVGGPYKLTVSFVGYNNQIIENVFLELGQNYRLDVSLTESAVQLGDITITAERDAIILSLIHI